MHSDYYYHTCVINGVFTMFRFDMDDEDMFMFEWKPNEKRWVDTYMTYNDMHSVLEYYNASEART